MTRSGPHRLLGAVLALGALASLLWVALWVGGPDAWRPGWVVLALTPFAVVGATVVGAVALGTRRWVVGGAALLAAVVLGVLVAPRAIGSGDAAAAVAPGADAAPRVGGAPALVVATANLQFGRADAGGLVALVRAHHVDVLGLQELTPEAEARFAAAGLFAALPYRVTAARPGVGGVGLASRHPLAPSGITLGPAALAQVTARVVADGPVLDVVVTHPAAPVFRDDPDGWAREIRGLPGPAPPGGPARLVMGDLNATLDHRPLRDVLARGHRDVAAELGAGLVGTWPTDRAVPPFAAIDHLLLSGAAVPVAVTTERLAQTDHTTVIATVDLAGPG